MRLVTYSTVADKDRLRMLKRGKDVEKLVGAVYILASKGILPSQYSAHKLRGEYSGCWECHLESNWLLIYIITPETVRVIRTGTHDDLF